MIINYGWHTNFRKYFNTIGYGVEYAAPHLTFIHLLVYNYLKNRFLIHNAKELLKYKSLFHVEYCDVIEL